LIGLLKVLGSLGCSCSGDLFVQDCTPRIPPRQPPNLAHARMEKELAMPAVCCSGQSLVLMAPSNPLVRAPRGLPKADVFDLGCAGSQGRKVLGSRDSKGQASPRVELESFFNPGETLPSCPRCLHYVQLMLSANPLRPLMVPGARFVESQHPTAPRASRRPRAEASPARGPALGSAAPRPGQDRFRACRAFLALGGRPRGSAKGAIVSAAKGA